MLLDDDGDDVYIEVLVEQTATDKPKKDKKPRAKKEDGSSTPSLSADRKARGK